MNLSNHGLPGGSPLLGDAGVIGPRELAIRAGQIPQEQAMMLRQIQELAVTDADLRSQRGDGDEAQSVTSAAELDQLRAANQMRARAAGVPVEWIGQVTRLGQHGIGWRADQLLPNPITLNQRRSVHRITHDTRHLIDMAAIAAVREHHTARPDLTAPNPVTAAQYGRTVQALWMRATRTGHTIPLSDQARQRAWGIDQDTLTRCVRGLLHLNPTDVDMLWRHYAAPGLADRLRASLRELRDTAPGQCAAVPEASAPEPQRFRAAARSTLAAAVAEQRAPAIGAAITEVLPEVDGTRVWETGAAAVGDGDRGVPPHLEGGPDP